MTDIVAVHSFLSHLRAGVGGLVTSDGRGPVPLRRSLALSVTVNDDPNRTATTTLEVGGPADVASLDPDLIVRTDPVAGAVDVEPNYLAAIEFDPPDLPWRFSPLSAADSRVHPWLALIVLTEGEFVRVPSARDRLPVIAVADPADSLPIAEQRWAWAHVQIGREVDPTAGGSAAVAAQVSEPERVISRLLCPRRLRPVTDYRAFVVPAFEAGRLAGLGQDPGTDGGKAAWAPDSPAALELPVYHEWAFRTGRGGDFESLVRRLVPRGLDERVGTRPMHVGRQPYSVPGLTGEVRLDSALRHVSAPSPSMPALAGFSARLAEVLNAPDERAAGSSTALRVLAPPIYGMWHAQQFRVRMPGVSGWLDSLNLEPRRRAQAGLGAEVIRIKQEPLMAEAWRQVGDVERANEALRRAQLGRAASRRLWQRRVAGVDATAVVSLTRQLQSRIRTRGGTGAAGSTPVTVRAAISVARLPDAAVSPAMRRLAAPRGALARRLHLGSPARVISRLNNGEIVAAGPPPDRLTGMIVAREPTLAPAVGTSAGFAQASGAVLDRVGATRTIEAPAPSADLGSLRADLLAGTDPDVTVARRVLGTIRWDRPLQPTTRPPTEDPIEPIMAAPEFPQPMYAPLRDLTPEHLLAGLEHVPADTLALVRTNRRYVESYLVGLNHEMSRELLWRGYPTDQRGTYFRRFFDAPDPDIGAIHTWPPDSVLGDHESRPALVDEPLALLIRGELLMRYPTAVMYAVKARWDAAEGRRDLDESEVKTPLFRGTLPADVTFVGFDLTPEMARGRPDPAAHPDADQGWFFVIQEQPTEPRFGFDDATGPAAEVPANWSDLSWGHFAADEVAFAALTNLDLDQDPPGWPWAIDGTGEPARHWRSRAADMAVATLQQPVRVAVHASRMLP